MCLIFLLNWLFQATVCLSTTLRSETVNIDTYWTTSTITGGLFQGELNPWGLNLNWNCIGLCFTISPSLSSPETYVCFFFSFLFLLDLGWVGGWGGRQSDPLFYMWALIKICRGYIFLIIIILILFAYYSQGCFLSSFHNFNVLFVTIIGMKYPVIHLDRLVDRFF